MNMQEEHQQYVQQYSRPLERSLHKIRRSSPEHMMYGAITPGESFGGGVQGSQLSVQLYVPRDVVFDILYSCKWDSPIEKITNSSFFFAPCEFLGSFSLQSIGPAACLCLLMG